MRGVVQVATTTPFHTMMRYQAFLPNPLTQTNECCEICRNHGHPSRNFSILQKYSFAQNTVYFEFCGSSMHISNQCRSLDALANRLDRTSFRVNEGNTSYGESQGCG